MLSDELRAALETLAARDSAVIEDSQRYPDDKCILWSGGWQLLNRRVFLRLVKREYISVAYQGDFGQHWRLNDKGRAALQAPSPDSEHTPPGKGG